MNQASITIDISVEKKCVMIPLNSTSLNACIQIIEHLLRLIKGGTYRKKWLSYVLYFRQDHIQHNTKRNTGKAIMNTTRGDQTDDVINMNNIKLVIIGDEGFMAPLFNTTKGDTTKGNTTKGDTTMKKLEKTHDVNEKC